MAILTDATEPLKKYDTKLEIEKEASSKSFDPIICQELNKNRLVVESNIRKNPLMFSKKSPYAQAFINTSGKYLITFTIEKEKYSIKCEIQQYHFNIVSLDDSIIIEDDRINIINKGQILNLDFSITGLFYLQKVSIYIKMFDFQQNESKALGSFNGVDINNNIVSGIVMIEQLKV